MALLMANPIYNRVFDYLLKDAEITRELLAAIMGGEITIMEPQWRKMKRNAHGWNNEHSHFLTTG